MKQLLFLLLFPCFALAQYPANANQKITLGEQTTADGLVYRGVAADTTLTVKSDTAAYFVLDTVNLNLYTYKASASGRKWRQLGADTAAIAYVNTYGTQTVNGAKTFTSELTATRFNPTGTSATGNGMYLPSANTLGFSVNNKSGIVIDDSLCVYLNRDKFSFPNNYRLVVRQGLNRNFGVGVQGDELSFECFNDAVSAGVALRFYGTPLKYYTNGYERMQIAANGNVGIGTASPAVQFHTTSNVRFAGLASITDLRTDADGNLYNGSDFNLKNSIDTINFGLSDVLKLKPVSFNWNDEARNINEYKSIGFIAQDVMNVIPNAASTMGDGDMQVDYNAIVATLTKAIQEQQALIKAIEQRIINLENK